MFKQYYLRKQELVNYARDTATYCDCLLCFISQELLPSAAAKYKTATGKTVDMTVDKTNYLSPEM